MEQYVASHLKTMNRRVIYRYISGQRETSRAEIEKATGISAPTVMKAVEFLIGSGLVSSLGESKAAAVGRRPTMLKINDKAFYTLAFVLEGEFLIMGVVDSTRHVTYQKTVRAEYPFDKAWEAIAERYTDDMIREAAVPEDRIAGIGIALPATLDRERMMIGVSPLVGIDSPVMMAEKTEALSRKYHTSVFLENDANAYCLGESILRGEEENGDMVFISVGTGIGAGIMLDGKLLRGKSGKAGEIGVSRIAYTGGSDSTLEGFAGYEAVTRHFGLSGFENITERTAAAVSDYLARPIAAAANNSGVLLGCDNIIIGGVLARALGNGFVSKINNELQHMNANLSVLKSVSDDGGLIGIANEVTEKRIAAIISAE